MHLKINGLNLHLEDRGNSDGLPLVFLHSWAGSTHSWKYVVAALPNRLRPITIDQRGWARSESHSSGFQLADLASDAKEVVKALKLDRYVLVGHSMGGKVAQLIASERPEKLSGLILVAPAMPGPMHRPPEVREGMVGVMNSAALNNSIRSILGRYIAKNKFRLAANLTDFLRNGCCPIRTPAVDDDSDTFTGQDTRALCTNPGSAPCDKRTLSF